MENIAKFIRPELLMLIPVLYFIWLGLKHSKLPDRWIPLNLGGAGIILALIFVLSGGVSNAGELAAAIFTAITQGVLCAGASVYVNQILKQAEKGEDKNGDDR